MILGTFFDQLHSFMGKFIVVLDIPIFTQEGMNAHLYRQSKGLSIF